MSKQSVNNKGFSLFGFVMLIAVLALLLVIGHNLVIAHPSNKVSVIKTTTTPKTSQTTAPSPQAPTNYCAGNNLSQLILVSTSARHMWACSNTTTVYDSSVITGMNFLAADITPTGTYHIYAKERNVTLTGSDSTGSWDDFVYYWMPFLENQYGIYGFHDATWRSDSEFGNISPSSNQASHGCVEMPLATAKWLYSWAQVGTTLTIN